jgi:hypothetical protein
MTLILSGTDGVSDVDGSAATPAVRGADANTGIFFPAADTIAFSEGGAEVARITNTGAWSFGASGTATGTSGQALVSAGSGAAPAWGTLAAAGGGTGLTAPGTSGNVLTSNGTAWTSTAPAVTAPAGSTGQVQINNAGAFGAVGSGTTGQVLTSQGAGAAPTFTTPSSGALVFLSSVTASNSATVNIETGFGSTYDTYMLVASDVRLVNETSLGMRLRIGGTYLSGGDYNSFSVQSVSSSSAFVGVADAGNTQVRITQDQGASAGEVANFNMFFGPTSGTSNYKQFYWTGVYSYFAGAAGGNTAITHGSGAVTGNTGALTGVRFLANSGNIASGTFRLYGIVNS